MTTFDWLLLGTLAGYVLLMWTNPVRRSLRDGWRAVKRYPSLWIILGLCGFCYSAFYLAARVRLAIAQPETTVFTWFRAPFRWEPSWFYGTEKSLWYLPPHALGQAGRDALLPALESAAGIFDNLVSTFPLSALAAVLLWINWQGHQRVLFRALRKRFGLLGWLLHLAVLLCATAAIAKPVLLYLQPPLDPVLVAQWRPVVGWLSFLFEYSVGVGVQIYLILLAYCWFRGITFSPQHLLDVAIRRFSCVLRWAFVVLFLSTVFIDLPLTLRNFPQFAALLPAGRGVFEERLTLVRILLTAVLLVFATVQITLTFHSEKLRPALADHFRFVAKHGWALLWLIIIAVIHFYAINLLNLLIQRGVGDGTSLAIFWELLFPWLNAAVGAWLLASWAGVFRRAQSSRSQAATLAHF
ncbi:MAG TPA: hypothetical protein VGO11_17685 [Chthoniobacteraceae bacterium]|jgi:hypothetical protein|nr:hypothetical protein [Chthoniobacteraceae bacterium]